MSGNSRRSDVYHSPSTPTSRSPVEERPYPNKFPGSCYCHEVEYVVELGDPENEARTSICYCQNCKKWTGSAFGITTRVPKSSFKLTKGETKKHVSDNGSGTKLHREFCGTCGGGILEYGENAGDKTYITYGSFEDPSQLPPRGEFFCKYRESWMPEIPGLFHKNEIKN
ncbi:DUF636 domain-containing protein [Coprinopsis cinerea okayama7|uniref:DUF636 domain-containing protein n=1 Tax=Coprinopsis cinerea (strain Okayama-7 / 130 / ATCC MYA-4618 / FGSC 9003) TaxID=240176 RepID=D6RN72_COPC7|nr:DUF636 domain-containing protein [Coprinopsis cinerea okayama7\|eukprot:XP_002911042.1 DUF636 domain-containing protein [Coprinopsis cinerea okayama7\